MSEIKPVLRQMIDNNKPHWRPETIRGAHKQLDEYESKAKAWDKYKAHMENHIAGEVNEEEFVSDLKSDYFESGELNA